MFKLERKIDDRWVTWDSYPGVDELVAAAVSIGKMGYNANKVRVITIGGKEARPLCSGRRMPR